MGGGEEWEERGEGKLWSVSKINEKMSIKLKERWNHHWDQNEGFSIHVTGFLFVFCFVFSCCAVGKRKNK